MGAKKLISGVTITPLKKIEHPLGNVLHAIKKSDSGFVGFQEAYFSTIHYGAIKPWKKHLKMTLNLIVPIGTIRFVLFDDRQGSSTKNQFMEVTLSLDNYSRLTVPPGICLALRGESDSLNLLLNISNIEHDPQEIVRFDLDQILYNW
jgi:dTDP-4-dehydrorhamnose 3,5-epimerase